MTAIDIKVIERIINETPNDSELGAKIRVLVVNNLTETDNEEIKVCEDQDI